MNAEKNNEKLLYLYWGKAAQENLACHLLPYHALDVAAIGKKYLEQHEPLLQFFPICCNAQKAP